MDTVGNVNHTVSIVGYLKFDSNYKKGLFLKLKPSNIIWSPSVGEGLVYRVDTVFYTIRYTDNTGKLNITDWCAK